MSLLFYYVPNSTSNATAAVLDELEYNLPNQQTLAKRIELSIDAGDTKTPRYLAEVNPNGRVPTIVHDGTAIWESAGITIYLGEMFGVGDRNDKDMEDNEEGTSLYPPLGPKRGEAMKWIVWTNNNLASAAGRLSMTLPVGTPGGPVPGSQDYMHEDGAISKVKAEQAKKDIAASLQILNGELHGRNFLLGQDYCLADTHLWTFVVWVDMIGGHIEIYPNITAWVARVGARPALKHL